MGTYEYHRDGWTASTTRSVWAHLAGTASAPFEPGCMIAVKVSTTGNDAGGKESIGRTRGNETCCGVQQERTRMIIGYHSIFGMYGFWLPNDPRGSGSDYVASWELFRHGRGDEGRFAAERRAFAASAELAARGADRVANIRRSP